MERGSWNGTVVSGITLFKGSCPVVLVALEIQYHLRNIRSPPTVVSTREGVHIGFTVAVIIKVHKITALHKTQIYTLMPFYFSKAGDFN